MTTRSRIEVLAVVPARGGSKGVPRKNLQVVSGKTLVALAVDAGRSATTVTRVVGSTDDGDIADELRRAGADVPFRRSSELARDDTPDGPVFVDALVRLLELEQYRPDVVVNVRPTSPLRTGDHIDRTVRTLLERRDCESARTVSTVGEHPYKMWTFADDGALTPLLPEWRERFGGDPDVPRQSLPAVVRSNGMVDATWATGLLRSGQFHPGRVAGVLIDDVPPLDIDTEEDLQRAAIFLNRWPRPPR